MFVYGSQYYRRPQPDENWEEDLTHMIDMGFNTVKVWPMWNNCHLDEDEFDFEAVRDFIETAADHDLQVHISVVLENAPHWLAERHTEARYTDQDGVQVDLQARPNTPSGGWPGLCLNHEPIREHGEGFLRALGSEFADVDAVAHYATWDEAHFEPNKYYPEKRFCYCEACKSSFVEWIRNRYGTLESVNNAWEWMLTDWGQIKPPRYFGGYPRHLDWLRFRLNNHQELMQWRASVLQEAAPNSTIRAHGIGGNLGDIVYRFNDDWESATTVEEWGTSSFPGTLEGIASNDDIGSELTRQLITLDVARGAAQGRRFWQTELQGGHLTGGTGEDLWGLTRGSVPTSSEMALWNWNALMSGAKGILYWQYRPEILGPESPGFGLVRRDGEPTERTAVAKHFATLVTDHDELEMANPVRGDLAIGLIPDAPLFNFVAEQDVSQFRRTVHGAYRALWESNYQIDFAKPRQFNEYDLVYLPFPLLCTEDQAALFRDYVTDGGTLIADGTPAVYAETGHTFPQAPGYELEDVFGAKLVESRYAGGHNLELLGVSVEAAGRRDVYELTHGNSLGRWTDGGVGAVQNDYGSGTAIATGTLCGFAAGSDDRSRGAKLICELVSTFGSGPRVNVDHQAIRARLHEYDDGYVIYIMNTSASSERTTVAMDEPIDGVTKTLGDVTILSDTNVFDVVVEGRAGGAIVV